MKKLNLLGWLVVLMGLALCATAPALAEDSKAGDPCAHHKEKDQLNLCRAFEIDKAKTAEQKKNRYQNKNHTTYYCSLIKDRDLQTFCFAVANKQLSGCGNIVDAKLEKECNAKVKK